MTDTLAPPIPGAAPSSTDQIERARRLFAVQREARWRVAATGPRERRARLRALRDALLRHRAELHAAVYADFRKNAAEFDLTELQVVLAEIRHAVHHLRRWMRPKRVSTPVLLAHARSHVQYEPKGQALILSPWNYPLLLTFAPLVAAVAAGNCVILRPSEKVPHTSRVMGRIIAGAFPEDEAALVEGEVDVADALLAMPFDHVFFTGSTAVGRRVMRAAAEHLATVTLELGGKSPAILDRSADVRTAAERITWSKFVNAGQTCVAPDYVLLHASQALEFASIAAETLTRMYGVNRRASTSLPRLIDDAAYHRLTRAVDGTVAAGARIAAGGDRDADERYLAPTLLADVPPHAPIMDEEIFGPVLPIVSYRDLDQALAMVNARPKPLALYVFARDRRAARRIVAGTRAGGTVVNNAIVHLGNPDLPFGGTGESGQGSYHGFHGFRAFSHERAVLVQGRLSLTKLLYPPYDTPRVRRLTDLLVRWQARP
ncbi:MAG TPA: aldehyde dehydrogenase family protein [Longimicrobium sp.]|nr:aldehyde dehydrogenase family protein [Longimicrobium sp.]